MTLHTTVTSDIPATALRPGQLLVTDDGAVLRVDTVELTGTGTVAWCTPPDRPTSRRTRVPVGESVTVAPLAHDEQHVVSALRAVIDAGRAATFDRTIDEGEPGTTAGGDTFRVLDVDGGIAVTVPGGWVVTIADPLRAEVQGDEGEG